MIHDDFAEPLQLMNRALALLDRSEHSDASLAACHLQAGVDVLEGNGPLKPGDMLDPDVEARFLGGTAVP